jgi:transposase
MAEKQPRTRRRFTAEFRRDAVELVRTIGRPIAQIARELGIYDSTLGNWVKQDRIDRGEQDGLSSDQRAHLHQLERDNARLRMERDLLKRTVAFWVKETRHREPLPLCRCPEGRRVSGSSCLQGRRGDQVGLLRLDRSRRAATVGTSPGGGQVGR